MNVIVQSLSPAQRFVIPWTAAHQASLSFCISQSFFKLMSTELVMPSNHLILCCPRTIFFFERIILYQQCPCPNPRACCCNSSGKGTPGLLVFSKLFLWSFRKSEAMAGPVNVPSPPHMAETPVFWPLLPEGAVKPPDCTGAGGHLQITAAKWIALTKCNVL